MRLNLHLDLLVDSDDDDSSDNDNDEMIEEDLDIIQEALRIARELNAQKEQPIKRRKVSEEKPIEMKRDGPTVSYLGL